MHEQTILDDPPGCEQPKILIVNDDAASLLALESILRHWGEANGCEILSASSGQGALRQVLKHDFAVILLDVKMPGMDGFETAEAIHSRAQSSAIPIIFVTAFLSDDMHRLRAYQQGAVDYLFTPIIPQVLLAKVSAFVALAKKNLELELQAVQLKASNQRLEVEISVRKIADQENRAKDQFLAMLGHELRNPLSAIAGAISLMDFPDVDPVAAARARQIIKRQSKHLGAIVDDLLDLARVMEGKIVLEKKQLELSAAIAHCVETFTTTGRMSGHTVRLALAPIWVHADSTRVEQMMTNLLDNALKYTPAGGTIDVTLESAAGKAVLRVRDSGIGMPPELVPHVFDVFVQGQDTLNRARGGLGIGLALVRQLVLLHGGEVTASSAGIGAGSSLVLTLPAMDLVRRRAAKAPCAAPLERRAQRVLLIEDNEDNRSMMAALLSSYGHHVAVAVDGASGIALASAESTDVVIVDIGLPGIDGYEVARRLRAAPATAQLRLIALTGYGHELDRQQVRAAGFDVHLLKPVEIDTLLAAMCPLAPATA
ncbi:MAG: response regulator [Pseudomonadota bacterium]